MHRLMLFLGMGTALLTTACNDATDTPLTAAAAQNDAANVRRLLAAGHSPDESGRGGVTALMSAARHGAVDAMAALLDAGADPNRFDARDGVSPVAGANRWTPLLHAIHKQQPEAARLLLERGADPNLGAAHGLAPLLMAADDPDPTIVELLLAYGANPRVEGRGGMTPLTQAVSGGALTDLTDRPLLGGCRPDTVRLLLAHDAGLRMPQNFAARQALFWARFHDCTEVLDLVRERQAAAATDADRTPPDAPRQTLATDAQSRR
jgi:ankyrin repeat protein